MERYSLTFFLKSCFSYCYLVNLKVNAALTHSDEGNDDWIDSVDCQQKIWQVGFSFDFIILWDQIGKYHLKAGKSQLV